MFCLHFEDLKRDIVGNKYSLLLDESNYISILKILRFSMIHYSDTRGKVVSTYLDLTQIEMCDAQNLCTLGISST